MSSDNPYPDLDPGMVEAAIVSGVDKSSLVSKGVKKNVRLPDPFDGRLANPLSESEGEDPDDPGEPGYAQTIFRTPLQPRWES